MINKRTSGLLLALLLLIASSVSTSLAQEVHTNLDAQQIMNSINSPQNLQMIYIINGMKSTVYQHKTADGFTLQRIETESVTNPFGMKYIQLKNKDGSWQLRPDMAIRMDFMNNQNPNQSKKPISDIQTTYTAQEETVHDEPCYVVTEAFSDQTKAQLLQAVLMSKNGTRRAKDIAQVIPAKILYYIGKDDRMIHGVQTYNSEGQVIADVFYSTISTNEILPDSLFQVPAGLKEAITKSSEEYRKIRPYLPPDLIKAAEVRGKPLPTHVFQSIIATSLLLLPLGLLLRFYFARTRSKHL
jgi:outer membrane lipoprotein-sorting protein